MEQATQAPGNVTPPMTGAAPAVETDLTGTTLGDFHILRRLGQGGMGQVYLAEQISLKRNVALKLLKPELAANEKSLERFKREAESVARATHANIVQVYAISEANGLHYMALEYVEGRNLREFLEKKGPPEIFLGLRIVSQVAAALQRASELGIVHRDIKPENILLTRKGEVKVADFGLTRVLDEAAPVQPTHLTQSGVTLGTPLYMSPEQVEGKRDVDARTDIYSLGVTAYHMFAGHPPFRGDSPFDVAVQHVQKAPDPLTEIRPDLPAELCALIHKMMEKQPENRFQTGREIVREIGRLRDALVGVSAGATAASLGLSASGPLETMPSGANALALPSGARRAWLPVAVLVSIIAALGLGGLIGWLVTLQGSSQVPPVLGPDDAFAKTPQGPSDEEKFLLKSVDDFQNPKPSEWSKGLKCHTELGVLYLKEKRLDDADSLFKRLEAQVRIPPYKTLGHIGHAIVLSFRDEAEASNKLFLTLAKFEDWLERKEKPEKRAFTFSFIARQSPALSEMIARALERNAVNSGGVLPVPLEKYRQPPPPTLKGQ